MTGIVDYGIGNLLSVKNAVEYIGEDVETIDQPSDLEKADRIILPGVGAFGDCVENLNRRGFAGILHHLVHEKKKPIIGICVGMQMMAKFGHELGKHEGLGWFDGEVVKLNPNDKALRVPHVGWADVVYKPKSPLFGGLRGTPDFYFVHSFYMKCANEIEVDAYYDYGPDLKVTACVRKNNVFGTQFHPEKSQEHGLKILENFIKWTPE
jgi:glutamine amidotransferase